MSESTKLNEMDGERGVPSVNETRRRKGGKYWALALMTVVALVMVGGVMFWLSMPKSAKPVEPDSVEDTAAVPERKFDLQPKPELPGTQPQTVQQASAQSVPAIANTGSGEAPPPAPKIDKASAPLMAISGSGGPMQSGSDSPQASPGAAERLAALQADQQQPANGPLNGMLTGTSTPAQSARILANRNFLIAKGTFIDCALQTRLDSTVAGMTSCVVTRDIVSDNGRFVMIEKGSTVTGEYQSNMKQGMSRIYVLWTRVKTPNGVVVDLNSPGADPLGGAGLPGYVNNHFWKRFGGAMLLSVIDDAAQYAVDKQRSSNTIQLDSTSQSTTDMASIALENTINIPPTLYKNQGERVGIYIARDLDFSGVYHAEVR